MVYINLVVKHGLNSKEVDEYYQENQTDKDFREGASIIRLKAQILKIIDTEEEAKIQNSADNFQRAGSEDKE